MRNNNPNTNSEFWPIYKNLEKEVLALTYDIHFTDVDDNERWSQLSVYSNKIADLLVMCCTQIEALFVNFYEHLKSGETTEKVGIGKKISVVDDTYKLSNKKVKIVALEMQFHGCFGDFFAPMGYNSKDDNDYYSAYNAVKHNRGDTLHKGNINMLVRAMAALYILNTYYNNRVYSLDDLCDFDLSQGSDIFIVNYGFVCDANSTEYVMLIDEDTKYVEKVEQWTDKAPYDLAELLKHSEVNPPPKRYHVALNKTSKETIPHEQTEI